MSTGQTKNIIDTLLQNVFSFSPSEDTINAEEVINDIYAESDFNPQMLVSFAKELPRHSLLQEDKEVLKEKIKAELDEGSFKVALYKNHIIQDEDVREFLVKVGEKQETFLRFGEDYVKKEMSSRSLNEEEYIIYESLREAIKKLKEKNTKRLNKIREQEPLEDDIDYSIILLRMINVFVATGADKKQAARLLSKELRYL